MPISRRTLLAATAAGGAALAIGFSVRERAGDTGARPGDRFEPNLWLRIDVDGTVTITVHKCEMGQGVVTALPMLVAEELEVDVSRVRVRQADADFRVSNQNTSGSSSIIESWEPVRRAGAVARVMLVRAAAESWGVPESACAARAGRVHHASSGRALRYGELVGRAARLEVPDPASVELKLPWNFRVIGRPTVRHDAFDKVTGRQVYGMDVRLPGMLYAAVLRCPVLSARMTTIDERTALSLPTVRLLAVNPDAARRMPGVRHVLVLDEDVAARLPARVAVVADSTWHAFEALRRVEANWDEGEMARLSSAGISARLRAAMDDDAHAMPGSRAGSAGPGAEAAGHWIVVRDQGEVPDDSAVRPIRAEYEFPFLAHACMETINCTARLNGESLEIWAPTQFPHRAVDHAARVSGLPRERIVLHVVPSGGAFGRRASPDFVVEAVQIARAVRAPVQVAWTRTQEIQQDFYRPVSLQRLVAVLDDDGRPATWEHRMAGPSIIRQFLPPGSAPVEGNEIDAAVNLPYRIPAVRVQWREVPIPVPLGVWRSVAQAQNLFAVETFVDELAHAARCDPLEYRRNLLQGEPRLLHVLGIASRASGWPAANLGVAVNRYGNGTFIALIAKLAVDAAQRTWRVERLTCAVDCGQPVNPLSARAQIEGGLVWGLSAALHGRISVKDGRIEQTNFHEYPVLRMHEMPVLDIHLVESQAPPGGIGEPCAPPVAPALANAIFAAMGTRIRTQPFPARLP